MGLKYPRNDFCNHIIYLETGCQDEKENETTNATVLVIISAISVVTIFLGVILFLARGMYQFKCDKVRSSLTMYLLS